MRQDIKTEWTKDLRSGEYDQTTGALKSSERLPGMCCLGVLAHLLKEKFPELLKENNIEIIETDEYININKMHNGELGPELRDLIGISNSEEADLINMNDTQKLTFKQIADYIDERIETTQEAIMTGPSNRSF